jgi:diacylglycerol kinase (ATP)
MSNPYKGQTGLTRIVKAIGYSIDGLRSAYTFENAFKQEVWAACAMLPLALWLGRNALEIWLLIGSVIMVMVVELLNSGIEAAIDRISFEHHPLSKRAKDQASAAVFLAVLLCGAIWVSVLWQRLA